MQKNPCRVDDPLQNPIDRESYEDAASLEDGIYPITTDDNTIISSDMVKHKSGTVEQALNMAGKFTKLWENPNPNSAFAAQTITLSSDDYDLLLTIYAPYIGRVESTIVTKGSNMFFSLTTGYRGNENIRSRAMDYVSATQYTAQEGKLAQAAETTDNSACIPLVIYGIKF